MHQFKTSYYLFVFLFISFQLLAQKPNIPKFGKELEEHLNMSMCPIDSSAEAFVIFDNGKSKINYNDSKGSFEVEINRHSRIKILTKDGLDRANFSVLLYKGSGGKERITNIKGYTYNLVNGEIERTELSRKSQFIDEYSDRLDIVKFTMPQVREGSVIEFSYTAISDFTYNLHPWEFQDEIPTLLSNYVVEMPEYFSYNHRTTGYENIQVGTSEGMETVTIRIRDDKGAVAGTDQLKYKLKMFNYFGVNIPKLKDEPYVDNLENYLSAVNFELQSVKFPYTMTTQFATSWENINKELLEDENFGRQLSGNRFMAEDIARALTDVTEPMLQIQAIFTMIQSKIKWNEQYRLFTKKSIKKAYQEGFGNSSEVNLCLVAALREAGFESFPIALSTRSNGMIHFWEVSMSKFNHVIAGVFINDQIIPMDATHTFSSPGILPLECLNGNARIIDKEWSDWIDFNPKWVSKNEYSAEMFLPGNGDLEGSIQLKNHHYTAVSSHNMIIGDNDYSKLEASLVSSYQNAAIDSLVVEKTLLPYPQMTTRLHIIIPEAVVYAGDLIYLSPGKLISWKTNPFSASERKLPVNFPYPFLDNYSLAFEIPQGYTVQEVPKNTLINLLNGKVAYQYSLSKKNNQLIVNVRLSITQTLFISDEYQDLRSFFDQVVSKNDEKIIFRKI